MHTMQATANEKPGDFILLKEAKDVKNFYICIFPVIISKLLVCASCFTGSFCHVLTAQVSRRGRSYSDSHRK